jgi:hypothetical protein
MLVEDVGFVREVLLRCLGARILDWSDVGEQDVGTAIDEWWLRDVAKEMDLVKS